MFCNRCGSQIEGNAQFCPNCGNPATQQQNATSYQQNTNPYQQAPNAYQQNANPYQQAPNAYQQYANPYQQAPNAYQQNANPYQQAPYGYQNANMNVGPSMPMGWYKFMIYFGLFAGAVFNFIQGVVLLTGLQYDAHASGFSDFAYGLFDGLETVDKVAGILLIALAVLGIVTRFRLSGYKQNAPTMVTALYAGVIVVDIFYIVGVSSVIPSGLEMDYSSAIVTICVSIAMLIVNIIYFNSRKHLFKN